MPAATIDGDLTVRGVLRPAGGAELPAGCVGDRNVNGSDPIAATKVGHQLFGRLAQAQGTAAAAERRVAHAAYAAGTLVAVRAGLTVACAGAATVTVDVRKNGGSVLAAALVLTGSLAAFAPAAASVAAAGYAAGDVFEVVVTVGASTGTLGQGLVVDLVLREAAG